MACSIGKLRVPRVSNFLISVPLGLSLQTNGIYGWDLFFFDKQHAAANGRT